MRLALLTALLTPAIATSAFAGLILSQNDGPIPSIYANGGGSGFGGTLGAGAIKLDATALGLYVEFTPGNALNDLVAIQFDTKAGGFTDADMDDQGDGGRRAASNMANGVDDAFPILPDYSIIIGNFGVVGFELNAGNTPNHLTFKQFNPGLSTTIPWADLGITPGTLTNVDFFAGYVADSGYGSNESLPASPALNGGPNVGELSSSPGYANFNRLVVPEPTTLAAIGGLGALLLRRRK
jgi:hypothetical protein